MSISEVKVMPTGPVHVDADVYPWIHTSSEEVPTVLVTLEDGTKFQYGSLIGLNNSIKKIADSVSSSDSTSAQTALFMGLPSVLRGRSQQGIGKVENANLQGSTLLVASRNIVRGPNLVFAVEPSAVENEPPVVLRAGISTASEYPRLLGIMGIRQPGGRRRKT